MLYTFNKNTLMFVKVRWIPFLLTILGLTSGIIFLIIIMAFNYRTEIKSEYSEEEIIMIMSEYNQFNEDRLIDELKNRNYKFPHIVLAQAKLETGNFTSLIFRENHNLFGMREAKKRLTTAIETQYNHAYYNNWRDSVEDYGYYYSTYLSKIKSEDEYYNYLSQYYAEDPTYVTKLKNIIEKENLKDLFN